MVKEEMLVESSIAATFVECFDGSVKLFIIPDTGCTNFIQNRRMCFFVLGMQ